MARGIWYDGTKIKKIWYDTTAIKKVWYDTTLVWTASVGQDQGLRMNSAKVKLGSGAHNPVSGGVANNWTLCFNFIWKSAKGGALMYHNYNQRESVIKLMDDGRIMVNANRYDTSNYKTWYSTKTCIVGGFNQVLVNKNGQIFINGVNATPSTYGGDMPLWGEFTLFPDLDINGVCLGVQGWNWILNSSYVYVTNIGWAYETDPSNFSMNFDGNTDFKYNTLGGTKATTGSPVYETWEWADDREAFQ